MLLKTEVNIQDLTLKLTSFGIYILKRCINRSVHNAVKNIIKTKIIQLPFASDETIKNFSRYKETEE